MSRHVPKHRRPTRTDRLLLWAKDRLTLRRRPQPALESERNPWVDRTLPGPQVLRGLLTAADVPTYGPREMYGPMRGDDQAWWFDWMEREDIKTPEEAYEVLAARDELESVGDVVRDWEKKL